ncbi:MAG TPA: nickel pincer cofactor biosynthesis protein LarC [Chloroflexi bacterium]|nr:nickel pincer cofactor biosynthesis protein LarC [Chloroflexota bacterium]
MKIAYFDCFSGVSGDMILGALVDAGLELARLQAELERLGLSGYAIRAKSVKKRGLRGIHVEVEVTERGVERHLHEIEEIITASSLAQPVQAQSLAIFRRLAEAEAHVHGIPADHVHFHEVGAMDAIIDVVGAAAGLRLLGVERVYASPLHVGRGTVTCAHGVLPVPAPATQELLRGVPIYGRDVDAELVTPTGAAILTTLAETFGSAPPMRVTAVGYGAGTRDLPIPNLLRVSIGETEHKERAYEEDTITVIEANIDDMSPQFYDHVLARLFEAGAVDVFLTPIQMKRNRPAVQLSVLVPAEHAPAARDVVFAETTTIGLRVHTAHRWKLSRVESTVETPYGPVRVKIARRGEAAVNVAPEYQDCRRLAEAHGVPLKTVHQAALEAARRLT